MDSLWEALAAPLERELAATSDSRVRGALSCKLALLTWDLVGDLAAVEQWLDRADGADPQALELRRQLLLERGDAAGAAALLESLAAAASGAPDTSRCSSLLLEAALLRLLWLRDFPAAVNVLTRARALDGTDHAQLADLVGLALGLAGDHDPLLELAAGEPPVLSVLVRAGLDLWDRQGLADEAWRLLRAAHQLDEGDLYILEVLLELAVGEERGERRALLEKKVKLLSLHGADAAEARAAAIELAWLELDHGDDKVAAALVAQVDPKTDDVEATSPQHADPLGWAPLLLLGLRRGLAAKAHPHDASKLCDTYVQLADATRVPAMSRVYRLRAAQLLGLQPDAAERCEALLCHNFVENPAEPHSARALEEHRIRTGRMGELCEQYEAQAAACPDLRGPLLRKAAVVAEAYLRDRSLAASLRRDGLAHVSDASGQGDLQRHYRALGSDPRLIEAYAREADTAGDPVRAALLWSELAVLHLKRDQLEAAEAAARDALRVMPGDLLALDVVTLVCRAEGRIEELRRALEQKVEQFAAPANQAGAIRELAHLSDDPAVALERLRAAHALQPEELAIVADLVTASEAAGQLAEAARWSKQLCDALRDDPARQIPALLRLARLRLEHLDDPVGAADAFEAALSADPTQLDVARELVATRRRAGDPAALLDSLHRLLPLEAEVEARRGLLLEMGRTLERVGRVGDAIGGFAEAAQLAPSSEDALAELERCCRQAARVDVLIQLLAGLPERPDVLVRLARAYEEIGDTERLCEVQTRLIDLAAGPLERADRRYDLGRRLEQLGRAGEAAGQYEQVLVELPGHQPSLRALQRVYRTDHQGAALIRVLEQELKVTREPVRRAELLLELARCFEEQGSDQQAAEVLEQVVRLRPDSAEPLCALERLYKAGHPLELARVLQFRAALSTDPMDKSALLLRGGLLLAEHGVDDQLVAQHMQQAFDAAPANREAFTCYESFLFEKERFAELMELYDRAIRHVEVEGGQAYRPPDLYSRKGQLQWSRLGQPGEAAASFLKAIEYDPKSESAMKMLETIFLQQQDWLGLVRAYEHRANFSPQNELFKLESLRQAASLAMSRLPDLPEEAERLWEQVYLLDPIDEEALDNLQRIYETGDVAEQRSGGGAAAATDKTAKLVCLLEHRASLLASHEARIAVYFKVAALAEEKLEDADRAAAAFENVRRIEEHNEPALKALARIYEATGKWSQCLAVLRDLVIVEADPDERALLYFKCGSIAETRFGDDEEAIKCYKLAINEAPGWLPALHGLRDLHLRREDWRRALATLELEFHVWEEPRERAGILARMGEIRLRHLKDPDEAAQHFEDALSVDADCYPAALALFNIAFERGDSARALSLSEPLAERLAREGDPELRSQFYCGRGQLLSGAGKLQAAAESFVIALELRPKNLEALDWLIALCRRNPEAYDFAIIFRELEQVYRREGDSAAVGHVLVAAGALAEIAGDAETALARYREATEAAPQDLAPAYSLCDLLVRLRRGEDGAAELDKLATRAVDPQLKQKALSRLADVYSVACNDSQRAASTYLEMLALDPHDREAADRLAQEQVSLGRLDEAYRTMRALLDQAAGGEDCGARVLSRYTHHLGAILLKLGDPAGAMEQFRAALQIDEANHEAAMSLARQLCLAGERDGAERLLRQTLPLMGEPSGPAALELRRSLAGLYLGGGRVDEAIACYDAVVRDGLRVDDRLTLAEIYARQPAGISRAMSELQRILDEHLDIQALHLLAELCETAGAKDRALQVLKVLEMLGGAGEEDRDRLRALRRELPFFPRGALDPALSHLLTSRPAGPHVEELWRVIGEPLGALFPPELRAQKAVPIDLSGAETLGQLIEGCCRLIDVEVAVMVADRVPGGVLVIGEPSRKIVLDKLLLERPLPELGFVLGRSLEYLRSGHSLLSRLAFDDRLLLCELLDGLMGSAEVGVELVEEFRGGVSRKTLGQIDQVVAAYEQHLADGNEKQSPTRWLAAIDHSANVHGLIASDEIGAALRMLAQLGGQELAIGPAGEVAVPLVSDGPELVRCFLSPEFLTLRRKLGRA